MSDDDRNPMAFPRPSTDHGSYGSPGQDGMTLRDYFAGQALAGMGTWMPLVGADGRLVDAKALQARSAWAYDQADAMLTARQEPTNDRRRA